MSKLRVSNRRAVNVGDLIRSEVRNNVIVEVRDKPNMFRIVPESMTPFNLPGALDDEEVAGRAVVLIKATAHLFPQGWGECDS